MKKKEKNTKKKQRKKQRKNKTCEVCSRNHADRCFTSYHRSGGSSSLGGDPPRFLLKRERSHRRVWGGLRGPGNPDFTKPKKNEKRRKKKRKKKRRKKRYNRLAYFISGGGLLIISGSWRTLFMRGVLMEPRHYIRCIYAALQIHMHMHNCTFAFVYTLLQAHDTFFFV